MLDASLLLVTCELDHGERLDTGHGTGQAVSLVSFLNTLNFSLAHMSYLDPSSPCNKPNQHKPQQTIFDTLVQSAVLINSLTCAVFFVCLYFSRRDALIPSVLQLLLHWLSPFEQNGVNAFSVWNTTLRRQRDQDAFLQSVQNSLLGYNLLGTWRHLPMFSASIFFLKVANPLFTYR